MGNKHLFGNITVPLLKNNALMVELLHTSTILPFRTAAPRQLNAIIREVREHENGIQPN